MEADSAAGDNISRISIDVDEDKAACIPLNSPGTWDEDAPASPSLLSMGDANLAGADDSGTEVLGVDVAGALALFPAAEET